MVRTVLTALSFRPETVMVPRDSLKAKLHLSVQNIKTATIKAKIVTNLPKQNRLLPTSDRLPGRRFCE